MQKITLLLILLTLIGCSESPKVEEVLETAGETTEAAQEVIDTTVKAAKDTIDTASDLVEKVKPSNEELKAISDSIAEELEGIPITIIK